MFVLGFPLDQTWEPEALLMSVLRNPFPFHIHEVTISGTKHSTRNPGPLNQKHNPLSC